MFDLVIVVLLGTDKDRKGTITLIYQMVHCTTCKIDNESEYVIHMFFANKKILI